MAFLESSKSRPLFLPFNEVDHQIERERSAIEFNQILIKMAVSEAEPCIWVPPTMPPTATRSGYCVATFNVDRQGETVDVQTQLCTDQVFCVPTTESITIWIYYPEIDFGEVVDTVSLQTKTSYRLVDEQGVVVPEPDDIMQPCTGRV